MIISHWLTDSRNGRTGPTLPGHLVPPHQLLSGVESQIRFQTKQTKTHTLTAPDLHLYSEQGVTLFWKSCNVGGLQSLFCTSYFAEQGQKSGKVCGQMSLAPGDHLLPEETVLGATSGQRRWAATLKPLMCLTTGVLQKETLEPGLSHVLLCCTFCDSKASLARPNKFLLFMQ